MKRNELIKKYHLDEDGKLTKEEEVLLYKDLLFNLNNRIPKDHNYSIIQINQKVSEFADYFNGINNKSLIDIKPIFDKVINTINEYISFVYNPTDNGTN